MIIWENKRAKLDVRIAVIEAGHDIKQHRRCSQDARQQPYHDDHVQSASSGTHNMSFDWKHNCYEPENEKVTVW